MEQSCSVTLNLKEKEQETNRRPKNDLEWLEAQFSIVDLGIRLCKMLSREKSPQTKKELGLGWAYSKHEQQEMSLLICEK